ncbi:MAG: acyl dehydratase [Glaciecola sp.]|jgi:acyl dehydratase
MTATDVHPASPLRFAELSVGDLLPAESIELTTTFVIKTAIASRDFEPVHHDPAIARSSGLDHIFLNILTTNGLCQRLVVDWAGPDAIVRAASVRLGVPALAGTTLEMTASVVGLDVVDGEGRVQLEVVGMVPGGRHCKATISLGLSLSASGQPGGQS